MGAYGPESPLARVPVPPEVRRALASLDVELGRQPARRALGMSDELFAEATIAHAMVSARVLKRITDALAAHAERAT